MALLRPSAFMYFILLLVFATVQDVCAAAPQCNSTAKNAAPLNRVFILSDISNEPDDQESLVRLLLHSDSYTIEGLVATTSYWLNSTTHPEAMLNVIDAYDEVMHNLQVHTNGTFPSAEHLRTLVQTGPSEYGMAGVRNGNLSSGASLLVQKVDASTDPLYVQIWGGASCLAQALYHVQRSRSPAELNEFLSKLRVYSISDQDNSGIWIRLTFPSIRYIASVHGWNQYNLAAWAGISGDAFYAFDKGGPDSSLVSPQWIKEHIQLGPLADVYLNVEVIMEGDSPSLLFNMQNGLNAVEHPEWGGWGGRYTAQDPSGQSRHYADAVDIAIGKDGSSFTSNHATIWRWRAAYQNEFAARVQWSLHARSADAPSLPRQASIYLRDDSRSRI